MNNVPDQSHDQTFSDRIDRIEVISPSIDVA